MTSDTREENLAAHLSDLATEASTLFRKEIELARAEMRENISELKKGVTLVGSAGALGFAGLLFLLGGVTFLLALIIPLWVASLIVGAITGGVAYAMYASGKRDMNSDHLLPQRTMRSVKHTPTTIMERST